MIFKLFYMFLHIDAFSFLQGNAETAYNIFEEAIATERQKDQSQMLPILYLQYSRFLLLVSNELVIRC